MRLPQLGAKVSLLRQAFGWPSGWRTMWGVRCNETVHDAERESIWGPLCGGAGPVRLRLFAWFMARCGAKADAYLGPYKIRLFSGLSGTVLEIGAGVGANLSYLPRSGVNWIGIEPNPFMRRRFMEETQTAGRQMILRSGVAEDLPLEDASVNAVISTLVLCSVRDPRRALAEILRVLKPGGRFLFIEHVAARSGTRLRQIQNLIAPVWRRMGDGCQPNRETRRFLEQAGFAALEIEEFDAPALDRKRGQTVIPGLVKQSWRETFD
jgi:ubiquinone/menaquinone biosynthesis C-methylase UbiE